MALPLVGTTLLAPPASGGLAPRRAPVRVRTQWLPGGDLGVWTTLTAMRTQARRAASDPRVQLAARTAGGSTPATIAVGLLSWLAAHTRFTPDPRSIEYVRTPLEQLSRVGLSGRTPGDCDDTATLGAALAKARGLRTRFVVVGFGAPGAAAPYTHVYTEVADRGGWRQLDIQRRPTSPGATRLATLEV